MFCVGGYCGESYCVSLVEDGDGCLPWSCVLVIWRRRHDDCLLWSYVLVIWRRHDEIGLREEKRDGGIGEVVLFK